MHKNRKYQDDNELTNSFLRLDSSYVAAFLENLRHRYDLHEQSQEDQYKNDLTNGDVDHNMSFLDKLEHIDIEDLTDEEMDNLIDEIIYEYKAGDFEEVDYGVSGRLLLQSDYDNTWAYCQAVSKLIQEILCQAGIQPETSMLDESNEIISYTRIIQGVDVPTDISISYEFCTYDLITFLTKPLRVGRTALIDHYCNEVNTSMCYSNLLFNHNIKIGTIEYTSCFCGAFSEEAFCKYLKANNCMLSVAAGAYNKIAASKKLSSEQRKLSRRLIYDLAANLSSRVKFINRRLFKLINDHVEIPLNMRQKKLLNFFLEKVDKSQ